MDRDRSATLNAVQRWRARAEKAERISRVLDRRLEDALSAQASHDEITDARYGFFGDSTLFQWGEFVAASGLTLQWKVECDVLSQFDWQWAARIVSERISFGEVEGVPEGGLQFAAELEKYRTPGCGLLIVDDVLTTGGSMNKHRGDREANGFVLFARNFPDNDGPEWVNAIWRMTY